MRVRVCLARAATGLPGTPVTTCRAAARVIGTAVLLLLLATGGGGGHGAGRRCLAQGARGGRGRGHHRAHVDARVLVAELRRPHAAADARPRLEHSHLAAETVAFGVTQRARVQRLSPTCRQRAGVAWWPSSRSWRAAASPEAPAPMTMMRADPTAAAAAIVPAPPRALATWPWLGT